MTVRRTIKQRSVTRRRRPTMRRKRGGSLLSWIKNKAAPWVSKATSSASKWVENKAVPFIRKQHLISKAIGPTVGFLSGNPMAGMAAGAVGTYYGNKYGFGKRRGKKVIKYRKKRACNTYCRRKGRGLGKTGRC